MTHWAATQTKLDQALTLERQLAQYRRQQQWQQLVRRGKWLQATVAQLWWRFGRQHPVSFPS